MFAAGTGCTSTTPSSPGPREFVGHPDREAEHEPPDPISGALWYRIEPTPGALRVRLRLLNPPTRATFFLPGPWAGRGDFDERIRLDSAAGPDGPLPMHVDRPDGRVDIEARGADWLELAYRVDTRETAASPDRFVPWSHDDAFFAYAPTMLVLPSAGLAEQLRDIPVEIHVPPQWTVAATWPQRHLEAGQQRRMAGFVAADIRSLRDAFVGAGRHWRRVETHAPEIVMADDFAFEAEEFAEITRQIVGEYRNQFGIYDNLSGIVIPVRDRENGSLGGTGRRGGFVLEIPEDQALDDELLLLLAHEALHMWNGHHLVTAPDSEDDTTWFKEGLTHYLGLKTLARLDLVDARTVRRELAKAGQYYLHNPVVAGGSVRAIDRARLPYDRGVLIALALDHSLFEHSGGEVSLEDWLQALTASSETGQSTSYDLSVLRDSLADLCSDFGDAPLRLFDDLVHSDDPIDVDALFGRIGLHFLNAEPDTRARALPIDGRSGPFDALFSLSTTRRPDGRR